MQLIRKRLSPSEGRPPDTRYNPDTDTVETTPDGGETWNENEAVDPRVNPAYLMPPNTAPDVRCAAAAGMVEDVRRVANAGIAGTGIVGIGAILLTLAVIPFFWAYLLIVAVASILLLIGSSAMAAAFTPEVYEFLLCAFYSNIDVDGRIDQAGFEAVQAAAAAEFSDPTIDATLAAVWQLHGAIGLSNAGVSWADPEADCVDCATWCYTVDLADNDGGFEFFAPGQGVWTSGVGLEAVNVVVGVQRTIMQGQFVFPETIHITGMGVVFNWHAGTTSPGVTGTGGSINDGAEIFWNVQMPAVSDGDGQTLHLEDIDLNAYNMAFDLQCSHNAYGGSAALRVVTITGDGDPPTFLEADGWEPC